MHTSASGPAVICRWERTYYVFFKRQPAASVAFPILRLIRQSEYLPHYAFIFEKATDITHSYWKK